MSEAAAAFKGEILDNHYESYWQDGAVQCVANWKTRPLGVRVSLTLKGRESRFFEFQKMNFTKAIRSKAWGRKLLQRCPATAMNPGYSPGNPETTALMETVVAPDRTFGLICLHAPVGSSNQKSCHVCISHSPQNTNPAL